MLYDPKWESQTAHKTKPTIAGFIEWLGRQKPEAEYNYYCAHCAIGQYLQSIGETFVIVMRDKELFDLLHQWNMEITKHHPWTFGAALKRAREFAGEC